MKLNRLFILAAALAGTAAFLTAGPDSRTFMQPRAAAQTPATANAIVAPTPAALATAVANCATCACCKKAS